MEKKMENEMDTGITMGYIWLILGVDWDDGKLRWRLLCS